MYISLPLPYNEIKSQLSKEDKIFVFFCNAGARLCAYGGEEGAGRLTQKLEEDGFNVTYTTFCGNPCNKALVEQVAKNPVCNDVDTVIVSGCYGFLHNATLVFKDKKMVKAFVGTYGNAMADMKNNKIILIDPYMPALQDLGITEFPKEGLPFDKLLQPYMQKYGITQYPPW